MTDLSAPPAGATAHELEDRSGYDPAFLGIDVPMPTVPSDLPTVLLTYLHYSVLFRPDRRFAAVTALDMDGATLVHLAPSPAPSPAPTTGCSTPDWPRNCSADRRSTRTTTSIAATWSCAPRPRGER